MRKVQFWQREMARIAEPIDPETDTFSQLFDKEPVEEAKPPTNNRMSTMSVSVLSVIGVLGVFGAGYLGGEIANNWFSASIEQNTTPTVMAPVKPAIISKSPKPAQTVSISLNRDPLPVAQPPKLQNAAPVETEANPAKLVKRALELIGSGELSAARAMLQTAFVAGETDAALALGRSFDPRVVGADKGNGPKALDWYEKWYLSAVKAGSLAPNVRVDRLFAPLRQTGVAGVQP